MPGAEAAASQRGARTSAEARALVRRRLFGQSILRPSATRPEDVVARLGAVQAQDYLGALWAVGLRMIDAREADVERALTQGAIVRSWPMRGTLHLLAAADARWMIKLLAPRAAASAANRLKAMGIDEDVLSRARRALVPVLERGGPLARPAAYRVVEQVRIATEEQRGLHVLWRLAHEGLVCFGPRQGKQQTFVLLEEWVPKSKRFAHDEALFELACRYFAGHGPATLRDFAWWSGLSQAEARQAIEMTGGALDHAVIAGERYWFGQSAHAEPATGAAQRAHALPPFDEFFVGYANRSAAIAVAHAKTVTPLQVLGPVVLIDGQMVAMWKRRRVGKKVVIATSPLAPLGKAGSAAVERALARYARFLGT